MYAPTLPALVRISRAFPPLVEDILALLIQIGKVTQAPRLSFSTALSLILSFRSSRLKLAWTVDLRLLGISDSSLR
jgi:hypothetical protein